MESKSKAERQHIGQRTATASRKMQVSFGKVVTSAYGQQIQPEKRMYNNSGAEVDMNKTPDNKKKSHERYTK